MINEWVSSKRVGGKQTNALSRASHDPVINPNLVTHQNGLWMSAIKFTYRL